MNASRNSEDITGACQSVIAMTEFLNTHQEVHMKISVVKLSLVGILSLLMLTGFTCSKHVPEKTPDQTGSSGNSIPQEQMSDQTVSGDTTPVKNN